MHDTYQLDGHKLFWHLDRVNAVQRGELIAPVYVEISPTDHCSHDCIFCGLDFKVGGGHTLDADVLEEAVRRMGVLGVRSINFAGEGEPMLHKGLPRFVEVCASAGIDSGLTTNGSVGKANMWERMLRHLTWVRFSVDAGSPQIHEKIHRGGKKGFETVVRTIRQAKAMRDSGIGNATIGVQYLLLRENFKDLEPAVRLFQDMGVDYLSIKPFSRHPQMERGVGKALCPEETAEAERLIYGLTRTSRTRLLMRRSAFAMSSATVPRFSACRALPYWAYISSDGDVYTCSVFLDDDRFRVGNINNECIDDILMGEKRRRSLEYGCKELDVRGVCRLNCRMSRINEFLEMLADPPQHINFI